MQPETPWLWVLPQCSSFPHQSQFCIGGEENERIISEYKLYNKKRNLYSVILFLMNSKQIVTVGGRTHSVAGIQIKTELKNSPSLLTLRDRRISLGTMGSHFSSVSLLVRGRQLSQHTQTCACFKGNGVLGKVAKKPISQRVSPMNTCSKDTACHPTPPTSPSPGLCAIAKVGPDTGQG